MENIGLIQIIASYGTPAIIFILIVYVLWFLLKNFVSSKFKSFFSFEKSKPNDKNELKFHPFFANAQYRLIAEIPQLDLAPDKPVKQQMFRDLIAIETQVIYDGCLEIIDLDMDDWSSDQWKTEIFHIVNNIISKKTLKCHEAGIPSIAMAKYNKWHATTYETLYDYVSLLAAAATFENNIARTNTLLLIMNLMVILTIADAEKTLNELNGEIAGKEYKNMIIEE